jgi:excisionase family DNA binding protein
VHPVHVEGTEGNEVKESDTPRLLTPAEVGRALRVDAKTVTRWVQHGLLRSIKTPGGHVRCYESDIKAIVNGETEDKSDVPASEYWRDKN